MGHAVVRSEEENAKQKQKVAKRLELLPEEALYLVERGAMFAWKAVAAVHVDHQQGLEDMEGVPMTVQQAFTEMIGTEDLTLEKYQVCILFQSQDSWTYPANQVYAYLKRLGYVVTRTKPPSASYPCAAPFEIPLNSSPSIWRRVLNLASTFLSAFLNIFNRRFDWWKPIQRRNWLYHDLNYSEIIQSHSVPAHSELISTASVFKSLRFIPSGHSTPPRIQLPTSPSPSPYAIFYNLYKPATPFKKTSPPSPDFSVVVVKYVLYPHTRKGISVLTPISAHGQHPCRHSQNFLPSSAPYPNSHLLNLENEYPSLNNVPPNLWKPLILLRLLLEHFYIDCSHSYAPQRINLDPHQYRYESRTRSQSSKPARNW